MELAEGELAALLEEMLAKCLGYAAPREVLRTRRASQAILARVEECLPSLPTHTLDGDGTTLLHLACGVGLFDLAVRVLERRADVALEHRYFGAPLLLAAEQGHVDVARLLLDRSADVMQGTEKTALSPAHVAASRGHLEMLQVLLDARADVHIPNSAGAVALHCAAAKGQDKCCQLLLAKLADANCSCQDGKTALHFAAFQSVLGPAEALLNAKADVNATDQFGHTPLVFAVREGHVEVAKLLLQHQADVNSSSLDGAVPLHVAAERGHATLLRVLLRMRADVHAKGCDGLTALDILAIEGNKDLAVLLTDFGATSEFTVCSCQWLVWWPPSTRPAWPSLVHPRAPLA